jgi:hypothetical protein
MYNKTLPIEVSRNTGNPRVVFTTGFDPLSSSSHLHNKNGDNTDWSVTTGPTFYRLQFQCKDIWVTFVFPEITWTEYVAHWASSLLSSPAQSGKHHEADHSHLSELRIKSAPTSPLAHMTSQYLYLYTNGTSAIRAIKISYHARNGFPAQEPCKMIQTDHVKYSRIVVLTIRQCCKFSGFHSSVAENSGWWCCITSKWFLKFWKTVVLSSKV